MSLGSLHNGAMISFVYLDVGGAARIDFSDSSKWDALRA